MRQGALIVMTHCVITMRAPCGAYKTDDATVQGIPEAYSEPPWRVPSSLVQQNEVNQLLEQSMCAQVSKRLDISWKTRNIQLNKILLADQ